MRIRISGPSCALHAAGSSVLVQAKMLPRAIASLLSLEPSVSIYQVLINRCAYVYDDRISGPSLPFRLRVQYAGSLFLAQAKMLKRAIASLEAWLAISLLLIHPVRACIRISPPSCALCSFFFYGPSENAAASDSERQSLSIYVYLLVIIAVRM